MEKVNPRKSAAFSSAAAEAVSKKTNPHSLQKKEDGSIKPKFMPSFIQPKLTIGSPDDPFEEEADTMADKVMRMPEPFIQKKCAACEQEDKEHIQLKPLASEISPFIQRKAAAGGTAGEALSSRIDATKGGGQPIPENTKGFMENRFSTDFSDVRIHTGNYAVQMSKEINAQAFTVGNNIYFNEGRYGTESSDNKRLLAHELTHTVQQGKRLGRKIQKYDMDNAPYGDPDRDARLRERTEPATVAGVCGPDITAELSGAISRYTAAYNALSATQKQEVCDSLTDRQLGPLTWDIVELHNNAWIYQNYRPACATAGGQPPCGSTVQVGSDCYYAGSVNYVIFGVMCRLCDISRFTMRALVWLYKRSSGNYEGSMGWAEAGYDGYPSGGTPPSGDRNNCTPTCPTPFSGPTFNTRICPHIDPFSQCPTVTR